MSEKNYQALIKDRIFIGGADQVEEVMENEKVDVIYDLLQRLQRKSPYITEFISRLLMMKSTKKSL